MTKIARLPNHPHLVGTTDRRSFLSLLPPSRLR